MSGHHGSYKFRRLQCEPRKTCHPRLQNITSMQNQYKFAQRPLWQATAARYVRLPYIPRSSRQGRNLRNWISKLEMRRRLGARLSINIDGLPFAIIHTNIAIWVSRFRFHDPYGIGIWLIAKGPWWFVNYPLSIVCCTPSISSWNIHSGAACSHHCQVSARRREYTLGRFRQHAQRNNDINRSCIISGRLWTGKNTTATHHHQVRHE